MAQDYIGNIDEHSYEIYIYIFISIYRDETYENEFIDSDFLDWGFEDLFIRYINRIFICIYYYLYKNIYI